MTRIAIVGGGLAGGLTALALARRRPDIDLTVIDSGPTFGGNHTWSFFDSDVTADAKWLVDQIDHKHWPDHEVHFPARHREIAIGYNSIRSDALDRALKAALDPASIRLGTPVVELTATALTLAGGERIEADAVIDARGPRELPGFELGWQKFVGRYLNFDRPHGIVRPMIMDATVEQIDGYRFVYRLPISPTELLIEDTYYSASRDLDVAALEARIEADATRLGAGHAGLIEQEQGVLPVVMSGDIDALWQGPEIPKIGSAGGFFHPTTSYSFPDAIANAALIAEQRDLGAAALHRLLHRRAAELWKDRLFFRLLDKMLFRAAEPAKAYRVLEHFYRLPPDVVARFYSARLTAFDKLRILSGKPPVPIGRAVAALVGAAK